MGTLRILFKLIGLHRSALFCCSCLIIFVSLLTLTAPLYTQFVMEYIIPLDDVVLLQYAFLSFLVFLVVKLLLTVLQDLAVAIFRQKAERSYCESYIASTFNLRLTEFNKYKIGEIVKPFWCVL
jgi:ABC-type bacteriocin/lantibiotic exporter with double-glycine peptidase domain